MKNKISSHWAILLTFITFVFFTSCGKESDPDNYIETPIKTQIAVKKPVEDNTPIQEKIDKSIENAQNTYEKFSKFRDEVFQHSLEQARSILCSAYRIQKLDSKEFSGKSVIEIMRKQRFVMILVIDYLIYKTDNNKEITLKKYYKIEIPMALKYPNKFEIYFSDYYYNNFTDDDWIENYGDSDEVKKYGLIIWGTLNGYNEDYNKPTPNDQVAIGIEKNVHAEEIIRSLQRLNMCQEKLPIIEREAAKALSFKIVLEKLKDDLEFDMLDPTVAEERVKEYKEFLNKAVKTLNDSKRALSSSVSVSDEERNEIINILKQSKKEGESTDE